MVAQNIGRYKSPHNLDLNIVPTYLTGPLSPKGLINFQENLEELSNKHPTYLLNGIISVHQSLGLSSPQNVY